MELFSVKRYTEDIKDAVSNENIIKDKLLKKIEQRKRKHKETKANQDEEAAEKFSKANKENVLNEEARNQISEDPLSIDEEPSKRNEEAADDGQAELPFEVLGEDRNKTKADNVQMYQPPWIAHPTIISTVMNDESDNDLLGSCTYLDLHIRKTLKEMKIRKLFPVQQAVIPWVLEAHAKPKPFRPRDICVSAPTGSGKTLAFAVPVVQILSKRVERKIGALVVLPVAELAHQVFKVFQKLCQKTNLNVCLLSKKIPFAVEQEKLVGQWKGKPHSKVDIIITTPGRLVEHLFATKNLCFKSLKFLVIDEADRIMDAFFQNWLFHLDDKVRDTSKQLLAGNSGPLCYNELLSSISTVPHKLLFSATMSDDPEKLQQMRLFQPKLFTSVRVTQKATTESTNTDLLETKGEFIGQFTTPAELTEQYCITEQRLKPLTLFALIQENKWKKFLCFTNSASSAERLAFVLQKLLKKSGVFIDYLSAASTPTQRAYKLSRFARGMIHGLTCSDALARGIDVPDVDVVISYEPPRHIKTYIHRVGRTARAGRPGTAILLLSEEEKRKLDKMLIVSGKEINNEIRVSDSIESNFAGEYSRALADLRIKLEVQKKNEVIQKKMTLIKAELTEKSNELTLMDKLKLQAIAGINSNQPQTVSKRFKSKSENIKEKKQRRKLKEAEAEAETAGHN